jgi:hypothetical protein
MDGWNTHPIDPGFMVSAHPDVPITHEQDGDKSIILIGHLLDPRNPEHTNETILNRLFTRLQDKTSLERFPQLTDNLCGRWVMIIRVGSESILLPDAAAQRQVHYTHYQGMTYCASQAKVIADYLGLEPDPEAEEMLETCRKEMGEHFDHQFWWPGNTTLFKGVKRLLPNHILDLNTGEVSRFFGKDALEPLMIDQAVSTACDILRGACECALHRCSRLTLACTSGWDTRVLMAAAFPFRKRIFYYTNRRYGWPLRHPDLSIPGKLLEKSGVEHHIIKIKPDMDKNFAAIYRNNVDIPHHHWGVKSEGELRNLPHNTIVLSGNVSEICRCFFGAEKGFKGITARELAEHAKEKTSLLETDFSITALAEWLADVEFGKGFHLLDMFYWEQRAGSWAATCHDEVAIAHETIPPFNCRELLVTLLSVDEKYRRPPEHELYRRIVEELWPDGLKEPINPPMPPPDLVEKWSQRVETMVRRCLPDSFSTILKQIADSWRSM